MCDRINRKSYFKGNTFSYSEEEKRLLWERQQAINCSNFEESQSENLEDIDNE